MSLSMLVAYDGAGNVIATLDHVVARDDKGEVAGLVDFAVHEENGGEHTDIWSVDGAAGSKVWPEWLGARAHDFRVELNGPPGHKRIAALIHKTSGRRRERAAIEAAIERRRAGTPKGQPLDLRDIVGGPDRPLPLDDEGRDAIRPDPARPTLPLIGLRSRD